MVISFIFIFIFITQLFKTESINRRVLSLSAIVVYFLVTFFDWCWLLDVSHTPFHPSDPSAYYDKVKDLNTLGEVWSIEGTNSFYFIVNWLYATVWSDAYIISFLIKINNILIFICAYLLLTKKLNKVTYIDFLLLFNPYTLMTMNRNVRDMYIILFVVVVIIGIGIINKNRLSSFWLFVALFLLSITRVILLLPLFLVFWERHKYFFSKNVRICCYLAALVIGVVFLQDVIQIAGNQMVSAIVEVGEDDEFFLPLLDGKLSMSMAMVLSSRIFIGIVSFLFTPHPVNFISKWLETANDFGLSGIYTGVDNILISLGSIFNYIFVLPVVIAMALNYKKVNKSLLLFIVVYVMLYVISYLGITDIRNRNTAIFFMLASVMFADESVKMRYLHYVCTIGMFVGILFFSR